MCRQDHLCVLNEDPVDLQFNQSGYLFLASEEAAHIMEENYNTQRCRSCFYSEETGSSLQMLFCEPGSWTDPDIYPLLRFQARRGPGLPPVPDTSEGEVPLDEHRRRGARLVW